MHLSGCFMDLIAYTSYSLGDDMVPSVSYEKFRSEIIRLIEVGRKYFHQHGFNEADYLDARFAVLAWVDECVMGSSWVGKSTWRKDPLQKTYYKTTGGGVEFFERLEGLTQERNAVREIYYMCLVLGFSGRFGSRQEDQAERDTIKARCLKQIAGEELFSDFVHMVPESYQSQTATLERQAAGWGLSVGAWLTISLPVVLFVFLLIVYGLVLNGAISTSFAEL